MSYMALYRQWRPMVFADVIGQKHIVQTLRNSITGGRLAHAYLFCGSHGTGKTTMAKLLARAVNCLAPVNGDPCNQCEVCTGILNGSILDVIEIDAASNNSVDNVREIRDEVVYAPTHGKYKVYIIDEVHMLSTGAFNALLKTLEEPPAHVMFILATTELHKLPATILSRCQRFEFTRISNSDIVDRLAHVAFSIGVKADEHALSLIARASDGALRDAISILDQCISVCGDNVSYEGVLSVIGAVNEDTLYEITGCVLHGKMGKLFEKIEELVMSGKDVARFCEDMVLYLRNILMIKVAGPIEGVVTDPDGKLKELAGQVDESRLLQMVNELSGLELNLKWASQPRVMLEMCLVKLARPDAFFQPVFAPQQAQTTQSQSAPATRVTAAQTTATANISSSATTPAATLAAGPGAYTTAAPAAATAATTTVAPTSAPAVTASQPGPFEKWKQVLDEMKKSGRMMLYANLTGTKAVVLNEKVIAVVVAKGDGFKKMVVTKAENTQLLEEYITKVTGREYKIKCMDDEELCLMAPAVPETGGAGLKTVSEAKQAVSSAAQPAISGNAIEKPPEKPDVLEQLVERSQKQGITVNIIDE